MDREHEEMQFLGLFGIFNESFKLIHSWRKIFTQISLILIIPLAFVFLLHMDVSDVLFSKIITNERALDRSIGTPSYGKLSDVLSKEWTVFLLFKAAYFTFLLVLSLLSTSAVVYTIACVYTAREVTFRKVLSVVPRVWRRLMVTFLCIFVAMFLYNTFAIALLVAFILMLGDTAIGAVVMVILAILYLVGLVYMSIVWQLASVVSVLEEDYGIRAMAKSKNLIKGKTGISVVAFVVLNFLEWVVLVLFKKFVVHGGMLRIPAKLGLGILSLAVLSGLFLFGLTMQTVIYFVCKSYHHENIDKSALSDHLEVYLGEYVPLTAKDVQLEQYHV
ncbi:uncharacterized protein LOC116204133 [Punica granatum]|uniref:Uncharacterized protein LOC116204133 n=1 Tax=Punica granatum TaxID=22663 RepID=A0A218W4B1_PUNGR|nr:uncharacterized protein LOC116204133 [Punica granatum]OWM67456.1 hypothetical protein CDL15_Pgr028319 [Punica granatum]